MNSTSKRDTKSILIWQWNCRSYKRKHGVLQQYICNADTPPSIIALQETGSKPTQTGYNTHASSPESRVATLTDKSLTTIEHTIHGSDIDHNLIEILPTTRGHKSIFVLNVYSPPRQRKENFDYLVTTTSNIAKNNGLVIVGDFNAAHPAWGYTTATAKGTTLQNTIQQHRLTVITDPTYPTRIGNSVSRDTCPDLTIVKGIQQA